MKKILIVDDEVSIIRATTRSLKEHYEIFTASSGEEALQVLSEIIPDLVLLDWRLKSDVGGKEILQYLKKNRPDIPVFVISGSIHSKEEIESLGADRFLQKPLENLKEIIAKAFSPSK